MDLQTIFQDFMFSFWLKISTIDNKIKLCAQKETCQ